jgi:hypothetical protein
METVDLFSMDHGDMKPAKIIVDQENDIKR